MLQALQWGKIERNKQGLGQNVASLKNIKKTFFFFANSLYVFSAKNKKQFSVQIRNVFMIILLFKVANANFKINLLTCNSFIHEDFCFC